MSHPEHHYEIFPWNDQFSVGVDFIDHQHHKLVDLLNAAIWQFVSFNDAHNNKLVIDHLINYARYHFHEEELLWRKYFPSKGIAKDHYKTHNNFFKKIESFMAKVDDGVSISDQIIEYLTNWLAVHILHSDRLMATMVQKIDHGYSFEDAERAAKEEINQTPMLRSSMIELYQKLSQSASQLIREQQARTQAENQLHNLLKQQAEQDLEEQALEYQGYLEFLAYNDPQTGLLNRNGLMKKLQSFMKDTSEGNSTFAVVSIDIDSFSQISAQVGTHGADRILGVLARRWEDALLPNGALAHLGGDDFVLIVRQADLLESQLEAFNLTAHQSFQIDEWCGSIQFTAGISFYSPNLANSTDPEKLLRQADYALYQAKQTNRGSSKIFDVLEEKDRLQRINKLAEIREAIETSQFKVYYQPKVNMTDGRVVGLEALIRWQHPEKGLLSPQAFLPYLEDHPLVIDLDEWVLKNVIEQLLHWNDKGLQFKVSVNIDAYHMQSKEFCSRTLGILNNHPKDIGKQLDFEILESTAINDMTSVIRNIETCRQYGITFSLDDFGKGYCSLSYLKQIPVETLKIDQDYIRDLLNNATNISILEGIIAIAKTFHLSVIAEGVENVMHGEFLIQLGCQLAQGYSIAKPMPAENIEAWINSWQTYEQWATSCTLRRDDIMALTGLAELNSRLHQLEQYPNLEEANELINFHSENLEKWVEANLEVRPVADIDTVYKIESTYKQLIDMGKQLATRPAKPNTPVDDDIITTYRQALEQLTTQIRTGLTECVSKRHQRRSR